MKLCTRAIFVLSLAFLAATFSHSCNIPPPATDFTSIIEATLRQQFVGLESTDPKTADGLAHMERNAWFGPKYYEHLSTANQKMLFVDDKPGTFHNLGDHSSEQWQLAEVTAFMSRFAATQVPAGGEGNMSERILETQMAQKAMTGAMRSMSPGCNVTVGTYSDRAANNCYPR